MTAFRRCSIYVLLLLFSSLACDQGSSPLVPAQGTETAHGQPQSPIKNKTGRGAASSDREWATFLGPNRDSHSAETNLLDKFPTSGPKILWSARLGTGQSGVTISNGRAITMFGDGKREFVICFDALTGDEVWKIDSDEDFAEGRCPGPRSTPIVSGEKVFALGASGHLFCISLDTGKVIWDYNVTEQFGIRLHEEGFSPSPLIDEDRILLPIGRSVYALDQATGKQIWKGLEEPMNHSSPQIMELEGKKQIVVLTGQNLVGLNPADGKKLWSHPQEAVNIVVPVLGPENQIFTGAAYGFGCQVVQIKNNKPKQVYKNAVLATHHATAVLHEGFLYGFDDRPGVFKCVEFATGKERWTARNAGKGNLIIADGKLIMLNEEGRLYLAPVSPDRFAPTSDARIFRDGVIYSTPSLANGRLYLRSDQEIVCIDLRK